MATTATEQTRHWPSRPAYGGVPGSWTAAVGFIGYAVIFLGPNFTDSFLELSTGPNEIPVSEYESGLAAQLAIGAARPRSAIGLTAGPGR